MASLTDWEGAERAAAAQQTVLLPRPENGWLQQKPTCFWKESHLLLASIGLWMRRAMMNGCMP